MAIKNNEELKMFIQSELNQMRGNIRSITCNRFLEYNKFLRSEIETRLYNALEDYLRERRLVNQNNWMLIQHGIRDGLATYDGYEYSRSRELRNTHLQIKSNDYFSNLEKEILNMIDKVEQICDDRIILATTDQEIIDGIKEAKDAISISSYEQAIDYDANFRKFYESIKLEFRGKLDANAMQEIRRIAEAFRRTIESKSETIGNATLEIFKQNLNCFLRYVLDAKMTSGYDENKNGAKRFLNL